MPIQATCRKCSKSYTVKDELAGKKFRCKQCQAVVTVPQPAVILEEDEPDDDLFAESDDFGDDDFGSFDDDFGGGFGDDYEDDYSPPPRKKKKPAARKKKKRRKKSSGPGIGSRIGAIAGGVFGFLIVLGFVLKIIGAVAGGGGFDFAVSWKTYTTPDGNVTVLMPGTPKSVPNPSMAPGGQSFGVNKRNFGCAVTIEPMVGELAGMSEEELFNAFEFGSGFIGAKNVERTQLNGRNAIKFGKSNNGVNSENIGFIHQGKVYTLSYVYKGIKGSKASKFFNSVKFN